MWPRPPTDVYLINIVQEMKNEKIFQLADVNFSMIQKLDGQECRFFVLNMRFSVWKGDPGWIWTLSMINRRFDPAMMSQPD